MVIITSTHVVRAEAHCQLAIALVSIYACSKFEALYLVRSTDKKHGYLEEPRDASCQLKSCLLPRNSADNTCTTSPEQIEVMKSEGYSGAMCNKHVHSTMTRSSRFHCPIGVINKPTTDDLWTSPVVYTDDLLWRNFLSPQRRNCSRYPDHALLGNTHSSQD